MYDVSSIVSMSTT